MTAFVGEHDYMQLAEAEQLSADLGGLAGMKQRSDNEIAQLIVDKGYGAQRISSQIKYRDESSVKPLPLDRSFALLGQRYVVDSHVADVHTDVGDNRAPRVLHVATGLPRMMVVTRDSCMGPRAYVGLAFAYHEIIKELPRLSDQEWSPMAAMAPDVAFMKPILP